MLKAQDGNRHPVIFRLATAFGPSYRPRFDLVVNLLTAKAVTEKKILIYNGQQWRPFIHVKDISRAFRLALRAPLEVVSGEVFNVGSNRMNYTLRQLAEQILALEPGLSVEYINNSDIRNYRVSFDKIQERLGLGCETTLEAGIRGVQEALRAGLVSHYRDPIYNNLQFMAERDRMERLNGHDQIELTALQFAGKSLWKRAVDAGGSSEALLRENSMGMAAIAGGGVMRPASRDEAAFSKEEIA